MTSVSGKNLRPAVAGAICAAAKDNVTTVAVIAVPIAGIPRAGTARAVVGVVAVADGTAIAISTAHKATGAAATKARPAAATMTATGPTTDPAGTTVPAMRIWRKVKWARTPRW